MLYENRDAWAVRGGGHLLPTYLLSHSLSANASLPSSARKREGIRRKAARLLRKSGNGSLGYRRSLVIQELANSGK